MTRKRKVEIFSAGCPVCLDAIALVERIACPSCNVTVLDMQDNEVYLRANSIGVHRVPAVIVDGKLVDCCAGRAPTEQDLRAAGVGIPL